MFILLLQGNIIGVRKRSKLGGYMDIKLLKTFLLVAKLLNITKAAEQLSFTQPAISSQIYSLEDEFHVRLFERNGKRLALTEAGKRFIDYAERISNLYEETQNVMASYNQGNDTVRIGVSTQLINHFLPSVLMETQAQMPHVSINVEVCMNTQEVLKGINEQHFDLGLIHGENTYKQIRQHGVWTEDVLWVASIEFLKTHFPITDISQVPLINYTAGSVLRTKLDEVFRYTNFNSYIQYSDSEAIKQAVLAGLGVSYLPRSLVREEIQRGTLVVLKQEPPMQLRVSLVHRKDKVYTLPMYAILLTLANQQDADESIKELLSCN
ncbi:HTH-type transcriptional regulator YofA [Sporomusa rhizae]